MDTVYPLLHSASIPNYKVGDKDIEEVKTHGSRVMRPFNRALQWEVYTSK